MIKIRFERTTGDFQKGQEIDVFREAGTQNLFAIIEPSHIRPLNQADYTILSYSGFSKPPEPAPEPASSPTVPLESNVLHLPPQPGHREEPSVNDLLWYYSKADWTPWSQTNLSIQHAYADVSPAGRLGETAEWLIIEDRGQDGGCVQFYRKNTDEVWDLQVNRVG